MIITKELDVDFNGIIIFCYPSLQNLFGGHINDGDNILESFTTTDKGDEVLDKDIALPIMGIDDGTYQVRFFIDESPKREQRKVIFSDKYYYLKIDENLFVADMVVFWDWEEFTGWQKVEVPRGNYKICIEGVQLAAKENETIYGYDLIFQPVDCIGKRDIEPRSDSRVL